MTKGKLRTIHVDIEGGWGGSSRSLFELVRRLPDVGIEPTVFYRQHGPLEDWYSDAGIQIRHFPQIASFVPRGQKVIRNLIASTPRLIGARSVAFEIANAARDYHADAIHLNYDGLFLLARMLRRELNMPLVGHSRAMLPKTLWGAALAKDFTSNLDFLFCISPNELDRYKSMAGKIIDEEFSEVMWNISRPVSDRSPFPKIPRVLYLGSIDWSKGTDLLVDVAMWLDKINAPPLKLVIFGKARTSPKYEETLKKHVTELNLNERIEFAGYTINPMSEMSSAFALLRPSRDYAPWGRDVIEATCAGLPVFASGDFEGVVLHEKTGFLFRPFNAEDVANALLRLLSDQKRWLAMSLAAQQHGRQNFSGDTQATQFRRVIDTLIMKRLKR